MITVVLICLLPGMLPAVALGAALSLRYGRRAAGLVAISILLCSVVIALIARASIVPADYEYNEDQVYPAKEWRKVNLLNKTPSGLEYRPAQGLFVTASQSDVQITGFLPACLDDGDIARYWRDSASGPIRVTSNPRVKLPPPPIPPTHQIAFDIPLQVGDTDILGAPSYAVYESGEVWCSERVVERGQAVGVGVAFAAVLQVLYAMAAGFAWSFVVASILAVGCLEIRFRRMSSSG
jgi:hypothetical protein